MTHGRKPPRKPRWPAVSNVLTIVKQRIALISAADLVITLQPLQAAFKALREGVATEWQWAQLASAINGAMAVEKQGVVKGVHAHLHAAELALQAIQQRAMATGTWQPTALYYQELDDISTAVNLHKYQLSQLSYGEVKAAANYAEAEVRSTGGQVMQQRDLLAA